MRKLLWDEFKIPEKNFTIVFVSGEVGFKIHVFFHKSVIFLVDFLCDIFNPFQLCDELFLLYLITLISIVKKMYSENLNNPMLLLTPLYSFFFELFLDLIDLIIKESNDIFLLVQQNLGSL